MGTAMDRRVVISALSNLAPDALCHKSWYSRFVAELEGNNIKVYLNDRIVIDYTDDGIPILRGMPYIELLDHCTAYFDDVLVTGTQSVQRNQWVTTGGPPLTQNLWGIEIDTHNPAVVYAADVSGPWRSQDYGGSWERIASGPARGHQWRPVAINPDNPLEVLIGAEHESVMVRSTDGGSSWVEVFTRRHPGFSFRAIVYALSNPDVVYAGLRKDPGAGYGPTPGMYRSADGGRTWQEVNHGLESSSLDIDAIAVHPSNPDIVYVATEPRGPGDGIYKTVDGGRNWTRMDDGLPDVDIHSLAFDPHNPELVYAGLTDGFGVFKTTNGGEFWESAQPESQYHPPIPWNSVVGIVIDPVEPGIIYAADRDRGARMSTDGGATWTYINEGLYNKVVTALALSADGRILYVSTQDQGVFRLELW